MPSFLDYQYFSSSLSPDDNRNSPLAAATMCPCVLLPHQVNLMAVYENNGTNVIRMTAWNDTPSERRDNTTHIRPDGEEEKRHLYGKHILKDKREGKERVKRVLMKCSLYVYVAVKSNETTNVCTYVIMLLSLTASLTWTDWMMRREKREKEKTTCEQQKEGNQTQWEENNNTLYTLCTQRLGEPSLSPHESGSSLWSSPDSSSFRTLLLMLLMHHQQLQQLWLSISRSLVPHAATTTAAFIIPVPRFGISSGIKCKWGSSSTRLMLL